MRPSFRGRSVRSLLLVLPALLSTTDVARAHGLDAAAWLDPGGVRIVAMYTEGCPLARATVLVFVRRGTEARDDKFRGPPVLQDKLDRKGQLLFAPDSARDFLCVIDDGAGHRVELEIRREDLLLLFRPSSDLSPEVLERPIAVSSRPLTLNDVPLWIRIAAGTLAIALGAFILSWLLRFRRRHAP